MDKATEKIIKTYDKILHGSKKRLGLFQCYDTYYRGCWDKDLKKIGKLKKDIGYGNKVHTPF